MGGLCRRAKVVRPKHLLNDESHQRAVLSVAYCPRCGALDGEDDHTTPMIATNVGLRVTRMNEKQVQLIGAVMEMISGTLDNMKEDPFHAPAAWILENWWHTLNAVLQVWDH